MATALASDACVLATTTRVRTDDGATIALHHHPGKGHPGKGHPGKGHPGNGAPVLLVHGISSNHRFFDLDEDHGLGPWLVAQGFDVWMLDLRGHGDAEVDIDGNRQISGWRVDDYGKHDVPAAIGWIRQVTGAPQVAYVGHSMGGMVAAIYMSEFGDAALSRLVVIGSPVTFSMDEPLVPLAQAGFAAGGGALWWFETPMFADAAAVLGPWTPGRLQEKLYTPAHMTPDTTRAMLQSVVSPMSREEMQQFGRMIRDERFQSWDRSVDYRECLRAQDVPALVIAGGADQVATRAHVEDYYEAMGGRKEFYVAPDYGHLDMGLGENADMEIFPRIAAWLSE